MNKIKDNFIVLIDCSSFENHKDQYEYIIKNTNLFINCFEDEQSKNIIRSCRNKTEGEFVYLNTCFKYLKENGYLDEFKNIYKVSGRYYLNDNFDFTKYDNDDIIIKTVDEKIWAHACVSCLFKINSKCIDELVNYFYIYENEIKNCIFGTEQILYYFKYNSSFKDIIKDIDILGMSGNVGLSGDYGET